uniref:Uncharacterized protein n=1 Tax=Corethron hystrix TaxID=216773 RepID=A0A7S1BH00_9STRA|mmetsp:Transcript_25052/g.57892  ORF Transcript_25052/g.57892 Transcript_25052/m.57892 type:complete len:332 (+) Transcript_25052:234-1229(+)|eukprot:CAMPEP_0113301146 /NCGR_PEP_ID=MMETSP0010_2-20120614/2497_1 /TAXON_ID=216773 ORGANISM="Corethron hystrix, Strain 308" /NCGR_SAMPLE_ID=MMETSP0010_2 /ASSEMBLY_ACC=CAM_ASM_000155 /LENGTH=331 /DNA_ID=CAMNT_0000154721 /DNA_START=107 /DNA_END=1102 /DNA_ORIENTATION=- /assembly_acc=CAM_ASM_000155
MAIPSYLHTSSGPTLTMLRRKPPLLHSLLIMKSMTIATMLVLSSTLTPAASDRGQIPSAVDHLASSRQSHCGSWNVWFYPRKKFRSHFNEVREGNDKTLLGSLRRRRRAIVFGALLHTDGSFGLTTADGQRTFVPNAAVLAPESEEDVSFVGFGTEVESDKSSRYNTNATDPIKQYRPPSGSWTIRQNPYCVTDRFFDEVCFRIVRVPQESEIYSDVADAVPTVQITGRAKVWGRYHRSELPSSPSTDEDELFHQSKLRECKNFKSFGQRRHCPSRMSSGIVVATMSPLSEKCEEIKKFETARDLIANFCSRKPKTVVIGSFHACPTIYEK